MRYTVADLPAVGIGAFTPLATTNPSASSYGTVRRTGAMGLLSVPVPAPTRVWAPPISADPRTQGSNCAPDVILPDQYIAYADNMGPAADAGVGMAMRRRAPLPVPAVSWILSPRRAMTSPKIGGRAQIPQPRAFQRFPGVR